MKKIVYTIMAALALAACTKSEVNYDSPAEIGFNVVSSNITKAAVADANYPENLGMIVSSWNDNASTPDVTEYIPYFTNAPFAYKQEVTIDGGRKKAWGGDPAQYWPNVNSLSFMGISKANGVDATKVTMTPSTTNTISITEYTQGNPINESGVDDLMWFPLTGQYTKNTVAVPVTMYHALSLLKFQVQGDEVTGTAGSKYVVKNITVNSIYKNGSVVLGADNHSATWTTSGAQSNLEAFNGSLSLQNTYSNTDGTVSQTPKEAESVVNGLLVLPQLPTTIDVTYQYTSNANETITETVKGLPLKYDGEKHWDDGYKYIYTITIKANEILIAPTPTPWEDNTNGTVTIE